MTDQEIKEQENKKQQYYIGIRNKLLDRIEEIKKCGYTISIPSLGEAIRNNYNIPVNDRTIQKLFRAGCDDEISPHYLIPVCNALGLNLYDVLQYSDHHENDIQRAAKLNDVFRPLKNSETAPLFGDTLSPENIGYLTNELYNGKYYCYYFTPYKIDNSISKGKNQPQVNNIRIASMSIDRAEGETVASFTEMNAISGNSFKYTGRVIRLEKVNKIYIFLSETNGNGFMWLLFNDVILKKRNLYYKEIAMLTNTVGSDSEPIFEKMILTRKPLDLDDETVSNTVRGILTFNTEKILVPEDKIKTIISDPEYKELERIFDYKKSFFEISRYDILQSNRIDWDYSRRAEALLYILSLSNNYVQSVISQEQHIHEFFFDLQGMDLNENKKSDSSL